MTESPAAAWYPDPSGVGDLRYWDGSAWTPGVVIEGQVTRQPMPWPPVGEPVHGPGKVAGSADPPDERPAMPPQAALYALAGFVGGLGGGLGLGLAGRAAGLPDIAVLLVNVAGLWAGLLGACWRASRRWGTGVVTRDFGLRVSGRDLGWGLLVSLAARASGAVVVIPFVLLSRRLVGNNQGVYGRVTANAGTFLVFAVVAVVGAPVVEELFFRGLLMRSLTPGLGTGGALVAQAFLFGLAHFSPLLGLANVSVVAIIAAAGLVFGAAAAKRRRLGTSVVAHSAFNLVSVVVAAFLMF